MKGDFSRDTFEQKKHFLRVLMQQGRVQVDADWNEQVSILLHYMQTLAADIIGPYGKRSDDFKIVAKGDGEFIAEGPNKCLNSLKLAEKEKIESGKGFFIGPGHYYVDGLLCENEDWIAYDDQPGGPFPDMETLTANGLLLVYLDVWERHMAWCEESSNSIPSMREVALGLYGPDTATRSRLVWQAKIYRPIENSNFIKTTEEGGKVIETLDFEEFKKNLLPDDRGRLYAKAKNQNGSGDERCAANPSAKYLGPENQLYRVEIHQSTDSLTTFKWSRDNGSVVFKVIEGEIHFPSSESGNKMSVTLAHLGLDESKALKKGDWVEFVHENYVLQNLAEPLLQVEDIDLQTMEVTLVTKTKLPSNPESARQPFLRRWDQSESKNSGMKLEGDIDIKPEWIDLEDGIQIRFEILSETMNTDKSLRTTSQPQLYRTGDYWLIPARVANRDIEWPSATEGVRPHCIEHHYAPLAILKKDSNTLINDTGYVLGIKLLPK
jgi:hypothetical protein